jgi:hypothetical protein
LRAPRKRSEAWKIQPRLRILEHFVTGATCHNKCMAILSGASLPSGAAGVRIFG